MDLIPHFSAASGAAGISEQIPPLQRIKVTPELIARRKPAQNGFFQKIHQHKSLGSPQVVLEMLPMETRILGITEWSKSGIHPFSLGWDILGYIFFGIFCLGEIWDLRKKGSWTVVKKSISRGFRC